MAEFWPFRETEGRSKVFLSRIVDWLLSTIGLRTFYMYLTYEHVQAMVRTDFAIESLCASFAFSDVLRQNQNENRGIGDGMPLQFMTDADVRQTTQ